MNRCSENQIIVAFLPNLYGICIKLFHSVSFFFSNERFHWKLQRSMFYVDGKESQKDILRLRQLEQARHENGSTASATSSNSASDAILANGSQLEAMVQSEN